MPQFQFIAYTPEGNLTQGSLIAKSTADAVSMLAKRGWTPTRMVAIKSWLPNLQRVSLSQQVTWYSMLGDLLASGMPLTNCLELMIDQTNNGQMQLVTRDLRNRVVQGESLSNAMSYHPNTFDSMVRYLVSAGEEGNALGDALERISSIKDAKSKLIAKITAALAYPTFLLIVGCLVLSGMMVFFVPKFEPLFERMRQTQGLPWATEMLFAFHHALLKYAVLIVGVGAILSFLIVKGLISPRARNYRDKLLLMNRYLGPVYSGFVLTQFFQVLGGLLASGVRVQQATLIAGQASGNHAIETASCRAVEKITEGLGLADALATQNILPRNCIEIIRVGERSNRLVRVLQTMSLRMDARNEQKLNTALRLLEPSLMLIMAGLIGFVMIALLMPIFNASGKSF